MDYGRKRQQFVSVLNHLMYMRQLKNSNICSLIYLCYLLVYLAGTLHIKNQEAIHLKSLDRCYKVILKRKNRQKERKYKWLKSQTYWLNILVPLSWTKKQNRDVFLFQAFLQSRYPSGRNPHFFFWKFFQIYSGSFEDLTTQLKLLFQKKDNCCRRFKRVCSRGEITKVLLFVFVATHGTPWRTPVAPRSLRSATCDCIQPIHLLEGRS